ncbi:PREDICTED: uncharacterized protein LOC109116024 [Tarenaya hassleriana]|uniref:uncharacterized protein LOC109116024 n=1 Tax=Tarenaya hassleriana TaxID=28532 RepID=UPI0008FD58A0|nr:PREDICTED: uncharacterized protein LOC109116024 [Tarenaya hassleriana]
MAGVNNQPPRLPPPPQAPEPALRREPRAETYGDYNSPKPTEFLSCIRRPPINRTNFELKPAFIQMLASKTFGGWPHEDPNVHLATFKKMCKSMIVEGVSEEAIFLWAFPYSLGDKAEQWLFNLKPDSIHTWEQMEHKFLEEYFPPHKTANFKLKINNFVQENGESLYDAWQRFKGYQRACPHHGMDRRHLISTFVEGLRKDIRRWINAAAGGSIRNLTFEHLEELIEEMARDRGDDMDEYDRRGNIKSKGESSEVQSLRAQVAKLTVLLENSNAVTSIPQDSSYNYTMQTQEQEVENVNYVANNPYSNTYNPGWRNHPNFSYKNTGNTENLANQPQAPRILQRPQHFQPYEQRYQPQVAQPVLAPQPQPKDELKELLLSMQKQLSADIRQTNNEIRGMKNDQDDIRKQVEGINTHLKLLDNQVAQMASSSSRPMGTLPGRPEPNPREHCNVVELRSGRKLEDIKSKEKQINKDGGKDDVVDSDPDIKVAKEDIQEKSYILPSPYKPHVPFPQRLRKRDDDSQFAKFADMLKKMEVNLPFTEVILKMPSYAKFLKDILSKKRTIQEETIALNSECSAILKHELPQKMKDPGSFSIPCTLGNVSIKKALCDLGASVSLMPLSICKMLNIGELKPTRMTLQLADRSIKYPIGILEDVPLKVGNFYVPVDFVVMEMDEDSNIPIILGRPFLATAGAVINVKEGHLTLSIGEEKVEFKLAQSLKQPSVDDTCCYIDVLEQLADEILEELREVDPLEVALMASKVETCVDQEEVNVYSEILDEEATICSMETPCPIHNEVDDIKSPQHDEIVPNKNFKLRYHDRAYCSFFVKDFGVYVHLFLIYACLYFACHEGHF